MKGRYRFVHIGVEVSIECRGIIIDERRTFLFIGKEMALPVLDLSSFAEGNSVQRQQFASELLKSLYKDGFIKIVGHGIEDSEVERLFEWVNPMKMNEKGCIV